jgi:GNAT superfamily N-acetyltransferase
VPSVSPAEPTDIPAIAALLEEMERFYGMTELAPLEDRMAEIKASLFDNRTGVHVLLARRDDEVAGLVSYSFLWPAAGITRSLYLKELYVSTSHRRQGTGRQLMEALTSIAAESGCSRLEWTADRNNSDARRFYTQLGFNKLLKKEFYRLDIVESE